MPISSRVFDYQSPVVEARIYSVSKSESITMRWPDYPYLTAATVKLSRGNLPMNVSVRLEAPYDEGIVLMDTTHLFDIGNIIAVRMGYSLSGIFTPWYYGISLTPKIKLDARTGLRAELSGNLVAVPQRVSNTRKFENVTLRSIIEDFRTTYGFQVSYNYITHPEDDEGTKESDRSEDPALKSILDQTGSWDQTGQNDWEFFRITLNNAKLGFMFGVTSANQPCLFVFSLEAEASQRPRRKFVIRRPWDHSKGTYPLDSFSVRSDIMWFPSISRGIIASEVASESKKIVTTTANRDTTNVPSTSSYVFWGSVGTNQSSNKLKDPETGLVVDFASAEPQVGYTLYSPKNEVELDWKQTVEAKFDNAKVRAGMLADGETPGHPFVLPCDLCEIEGASKRYDGIWRIETVTHQFDDGWNTLIEFLSDGTEVREFLSLDPKAKNTQARIPGPEGTWQVGNLVIKRNIDPI